jgi:ariadne-1
MSTSDESEVELSDKLEESDSDSASDLVLSQFIDESIESNKCKGRQELSYKVLTIDEIVKQMQQIIEEVKAVIRLPSATIRTLLKHFKWDTQKCLEQLFENNREKLFKEIGIVFEEDSSEGTQCKRFKLSDNSVNSGIGVCNICYVDIKTKQMFGLDCGHLYCTDCWNQYLTTKVMSEGNVCSMTCAETKCKVIVDDKQVLQLLSDASVKLKYQRLTTNSFVESNRLLRWCTKADCDHAFSVEVSGAQLVRCVCGTQICFGCGQSNHMSFTSQMD